MFGIGFILGRERHTNRYKLLTGTPIQPRMSATEVDVSEGIELNQVDETIVDTVKAVKATLEIVDESKANDPVEITNYIKDETNHIAVRHDVDEEKVELALRKVSNEEIPPYVAPDKTFPLAELLKGEPLTDLNLIEKRKMVAMHHAPGGVGSKGSFIIGCARKSKSKEQPLELFVLKELTLASPSEVFASVVMRKMGLRAPKMKIFSFDEFSELSMKLRDALPTSEGSCIVLFDPAVQKSGFLAMEFLQGKTVSDATRSDLLGLHSQSMLKEIGRCMAVDMAINCLDRIPIIWNNNGNPTNLMLFANHICVIDSAYNRILHPEAAQERADSVLRCIEELKSDNPLGEHATRVRDFFSSSTKGRVVLTDEELLIIMTSMREACQYIHDRHKELFEECANITRSLFQRCENEGGGVVALQQLDECLDLSFCTKCAEQMDSGIKVPVDLYGPRKED